MAKGDRILRIRGKRWRLRFVSHLGENRAAAIDRQSSEYQPATARAAETACRNRRPHSAAAHHRSSDPPPSPDHPDDHHHPRSPSSEPDNMAAPQNARSSMSECRTPVEHTGAPSCCLVTNQQQSQSDCPPADQETASAALREQWDPPPETEGHEYNCAPTTLQCHKRST